MRAVRAVLVLVLVLLLVAFLYNNHFGVDQKVDVKLEPLMANRVGVPLVTVVFWAFAGGAILTMLLFVSIYVRQSMQTHAAKRRIKALESEVAILRNRPIEESAELLKGADKRRTDLRSPFAEG